MSTCNGKSSFYGCMYDAQGNLVCKGDLPSQPKNKTVEHFYEEDAKKSLQAFQDNFMTNFMKLGKTFDTFGQIPDHN